MPRKDLGTPIPKNRKSNINSKGGSWLANTAKSLGYSSIDVLTEVLPNTMNMTKTALETSQTMISEMKDFKTIKGRLSQTMENNVYLDLMNQFKSNAIEDLKSGKFYNKERQDASMNDDFDLDFDNFDVGDSSDFNSSVSSNDGSTSVSMERKSGDKQEVDVITVNTNINKNNPMVGAVENQTKLAIQASTANIELSKRNQLMTMNMLQQLGQNVGGILTSINANVISISKDTTEVFSRHLGLATKYYDDSIKLFTDIHKELQEMNSKTSVAANANNPNLQTKEYQDVLDIFSGGTVDLKAYMNLVRKQWDSASDSNLFLSSVKNIAGQTDVLGMMASNPLKFISDGIVKKFIPNIFKQVAQDFDQTLGETLVSKMYQVGNLQNSNNPILELVGKVFGITNKKISFDKSQYERGKVEWNGISHKTLNDVIPTYLRKILSAITGGQEIAFDYEKGSYSYVNDIVKDQKLAMENKMIAPLSNMISDFKDYLGKMSFVDSTQKDSLENSFRQLAIGLVNSEGGKNFRAIKQKDGTTRDDIASLLSKNSSDPIVQIIRGFFQGSKNADVMRFFNRDVLEAKSGYSKYIQEMMEDPTKYNAQYYNLSNAVSHDKFLEYDKKTGRDVVKFKKGAPGADNYNNTPNDYLRGILETLNRGIRVAVVNSTGTRGGRVSSNADYTSIVSGSESTMKSLRDDKTKLSNTQSKYKRAMVGRTLSHSERLTMLGKGRTVVDLDQTGGINSTLAKSIREQQIAEQDAVENNAALSSIGVLANNSALNKLVNKFSEYMEKPSQIITGMFKKADNFLFKLVFGEDEVGSERSLISKAFDYMKGTFNKFTLWMDEKIITPLHDSLFGDNGLFTNIKNSQMYQDVKGYLGNAVTAVLGEKGEDGLRQGGILSGFNNQLKASMGLIKQSLIGGRVKDANGNWVEQTSPSILDHTKNAITSIGSNLGQMFGIQKDETRVSSGNTLIDTVDSIWDTVKRRTNSLLDDILGPDSSDPNSRRAKVNTFMSETKKALPTSMAYGVIGGGATLGFGLMGSWFLPGGPIGGALLGAGIGMVSGSETLKRTLFGDLVDDGNGGVKRAGAIINQETQQFFKDHAKGMLGGGALGAVVGSKLGFLGGMFSPLGPIGGALMGAGLSMATKTEAFQELLWGTNELDEHGNQIKRGILGTLKDKANKSSFSDKFLDAGIGAGVGLVGSFFLPGGPIMGALLGAVGGLTLNSERFKKLFFGEKGEDGGRQGGLLGSVKTWFSDNVGNPLRKTIDKTQMHVMNFIEENMVLPFTKAMAPITAEFGKLKDRIAIGFKNVMESFKDNTNKTFERFFGKPLGEFMQDNIYNPLKNLLGRIFGGIGKVVGTIAASPFKLMNTVADGLFTKHQKEGKQAYIDDSLERIIGSDSRKQRRERGEKRKLFSTYDKDGNRIGGGLFGDIRDVASIKKYKESANGDKGAYYNKNNDWVNRNNALESEFRARADRRQLDFDNKWQNGGVGTVTPKGLKQRADSSKGAKPIGTTTRGETILSTGEVVSSTTGSVGKSSKIKFISDKFNTSRAKYNLPTRSTQLRLTGSKDDNTQVANDEDRAKAVSSMDSKISKANVKSVKLSQAQRDSLLKNIEGYTKVIATEVRGQLDGVGSNIYKLRTIVQRKLGVSDDDVSGSSNRDRLGLWGKLKRGIKHPLDFMKDMLTAPIKGVTNFVIGSIDKAKKAITLPFKLLGKTISAIGQGIKATGKGILVTIKGMGSMLKFFAGSIYETIKMIGPMVAETAVQGIRFVGTTLTEGVKLVGKTLHTAVSTVGGVLVGAAKGIGSAVGTALKVTAKTIGAGVLFIKDTLFQAGGLLLKGAGMLGRAAMEVASAPFKIVGSLFGWTKDKFNKTNKSNFIQKVQVIGGKLDYVDTIRLITSIRSDKTSPKVTPDADGKIGNTQVASSTDGMHTALTLYGNDQDDKLAKTRQLKERKDNAKDFKYFKKLDSEQDKAEVEQRQRISFMSKLSELTETTKAHASNWSSMFGKKGLIAGALIVGLPLLWKFIKNFDWASIGTSIVSAFKNFGSNDPVAAYDNQRRHDPDREGEYISNDFYNQAKFKAGLEVIQYGARSGSKLLGKVKDVAKPIVQTTRKIAGSSFGKTVATGAKATTGATSGIVDKVLTQFKKGIDIFLNNKIVQKVLGSNTVQKVSKSIASLLPNMKKTFIDNFAKLSVKLGKIASDATWAFPPLGLTIDIVFAISDSITGWNDAGKIFRVAKDDVTLGMRVVASLTKVLVGWNGLIDFCNEIIRIMTDGTGLRELLADLIYNAAVQSGVIFGSSPEDNNLQEKQRQNKEDYKAYNQQLIDQGKDEISFSAYQDKMHEGLWDKTKNWASDAWDSTKTWASDAWESTKQAGTKLKNSAVEGLHNLSGNLFNTQGVRDTLGLNGDQKVTLRDRLSVTMGSVLQLISGGKLEKSDSAKAIYALSEKAMNSAKDMWEGVKDWISTQWTNVKTGFSKATDSMNKSLGGMFGFVDDNGNPLPFTSSISELVSTNLRKTMDTMTDLKDKALEQVTELSTRASTWWKDTKTNWSSFTDTLNKNVGGMFGFVDDSGNAISFTAKISDVTSKTLDGIASTVNSIRKSSSDWWDSVKVSFKKDMDELKKNLKNMPSVLDKMLGSFFGLSTDSGDKLGLFEWMGQKAKSASTSLSNWWDDLTNQGDSYIETRNNTSGGFGGEDFAYYSQNDPRYANAPYLMSNNGQNTTGIPETIGKRGCGPTSLAMVASQLTGQNIDPVTLSNISTAQGYSTNMGTDPDYFKNVGSQFGLSVGENNTSEASLRSALSSGQPVILQGVSSGPNSAFTSAGHYVVATKADGDKIMINDPRGKKYSRSYNIDRLVSESGKMWSFGNTGFGDETVSKTIGQQMVDIASSLIGRPYVWGAEGPEDWDGDGETSQGFDCSGLISYAGHNAGLTGYGRETAKTLHDKTTRINKSDLVVGDLGFIIKPNGNNHVGIYAGDDQWVEATGDPINKVRKVPTSQASKWTSYGRLKGVNGQASNTYVSGANYASTNNSQGTENPGFLSGLFGVVQNNINKFFGIDNAGTTSGSTNSNTVANSLRDAVNIKTRELMAQSESGGDYSKVENDINASTGKKISPSIGLLQWRGDYVSEIMRKMNQKLPNDPDSSYYANMNWAAEGKTNSSPWGSSKLTKLRNYFKRNMNVTKQVQDEYSNSYIDNRLTSSVYKNLVDSGKISDPRSMVLLNEIAQTGPGHITTFASKYNPIVPDGKSEFDHFYDELTSNKSYWGSRMNIYGNRFKKNKEKLQNWSPSVKTTTGGSGQRNNPVVMGFGDVKPANRQCADVKIVNKDFRRESQVSRLHDTVQGFGTSGVTDNRVVQLLSTMVDYLKGTKEGIDKFNDKEFTVSVPVTNISDNSTNITTTNKSTTNRVPSQKSSKTVNTKTDDSAYMMARKIASGLVV